MDWQELPGLFPGLPEPDRWLPLLELHHELLLQAAPHTRVTAVGASASVQRQYAESLEIWRIARAKLASAPRLVVDVGSGGGFPGLVMASVASETRFALVEPHQKKAHLLESVCRELGLTNVEVCAQRAEEAGRGPLREAADLVTARAVAGLPVLLEYTAPLARPGALLCLPKGSLLDSELAAGQNAMVILGCELAAAVPMRPAISETISVALLQKVATTPERYPRRAGAPTKSPL